MYPRESKTKRLGRNPIFFAGFAIFNFYVISSNVFSEVYIY